MLVVTWDQTITQQGQSATMTVSGGTCGHIRCEVCGPLLRLLVERHRPALEGLAKR